MGGGGVGTDVDENEPKKRRRKEHQGRRAPVLRWMRNPVYISGASEAPAVVDGAAARSQSEWRTPIDRRLFDCLAKDFQIHSLFTVQRVCWDACSGGLLSDNDICLCAPTGSGKTLAYVLPAVHGIGAELSRGEDAGRGTEGASWTGTHRLRALVVVPTRELAVQVHGVAAPLCSSLNLRCSIVAGVHSPRHESECMRMSTGRSWKSMWEASAATMMGAEDDDDVGVQEDAAVASDFVVATPGRLVSALQSVEGTGRWADGAAVDEPTTTTTGAASVNPLAHLRFLIIDEVDRLLRQSYQGWLDMVLHHVHSGRDASGRERDATMDRRSILDARPRCVKIIASATLTRDPVKIERLRLTYPIYVNESAGRDDEDGADGEIDEKYKHQLPEHLTEYKMTTSAGNKPLALLTLLVMLNADAGGTGEGKSVIIFTGSLEASHRLAALLPAFRKLCRRRAKRVQLGGDDGGGEGGEDNGGTEMSDGLAAIVASPALSSAQFSSSMTHAQRAAALDSFRQGKRRILIASDAATRGIDIDNVDVVINYDAPVFARTYVHRVGRCARKGKAGTAVTIMGKHEVRHFKSLIRKNSSSSLIDFGIDYDTLNAMRPVFERALSEVQDGPTASNDRDDAVEEDDDGQQKPADSHARGRKRMVSRAMKVDSAAGILRRQFRSNIGSYEKAT